MSVLHVDFRILSFGLWRRRRTWKENEESFFFLMKNKTEMKKITSGEGKYIFSEENKTGKRKLRNEFGDRKYIFWGEKIHSRGKEENVFFAEEKNGGEGKGGSFARGRSIWMIFVRGRLILMII